MDLLVETYLKNLYLTEEIMYISEDVASFLNRFKPESLINLKDKIKNALKQPPDLDKLETLSKMMKIPSVGIDKITQVSKKLSGDFKTNFNFAKKVLDNSFPDGVNDDLKKAAATILSMKGIQSKIGIKTIIKGFVDVIRYLVRSFLNRLAEVPKSTMFEAVIGWVIIFLCLGALMTILVQTPLITGLAWYSGIYPLILLYVITVFGRFMYNTFNSREMVARIIKAVGGGDKIYPENQEEFDARYPEK